MTFSAFFGKKTRILLVCLLTLVMLASLCLTAGAAVKDEQTLLTLDPNTMSLAGNDANFSWSNTSGHSLVSKENLGTYTGKVLQCKPGIYWINDTNGILPAYEVVVVSTDLYFDDFPSGTTVELDQKKTCDPNSELPFLSKSILSWPGTYDGLRIDCEGNLYSSTDISSAIGFRLEEKTWYNLKLIYSKASNRTEIWVDGERVATTNVQFRTQAQGIRFFDGRYSYIAYAKNISISASNTPYYTGIVKEASSDFISYQTTLPQNGSFQVRLIAGINDLNVPAFGYKVVKLTKDENGNTVSELLTGTDDKVYSSIYGGETAYSIESMFGYKYACLATVPDLAVDSKYTELVVFPYTESFTGDKVYGTPISLVYTGATYDDGHPKFVNVKTTQTNLAPTDDTFISKLSTEKNVPKGSVSQLNVRNIVNEATDTMYRAAYFKFTIPKQTVERLDTMANAFLNVNVFYEEINDNTKDRTKDPLSVYTSTTDWDEATLTYEKHSSETIAARGKTLDTVAGEDCGGYIKFNVLDYVKEQANTQVNEDGSLTVAFCITQEDGHKNPLMLYLYTKERAAVNNQSVAPVLSLEESLYGHDISNVKAENIGFEPLSYAEKLVDAWFDEIYPEIYLDENGDPLYHSAENAFAPTGYATTAEGGEGDFKVEMLWKNSTVWNQSKTKNPISSFVLQKEKWNQGSFASRFARTLATLGTSTSNQYLTSAYAKTTTEYDAYGGITNLGFTGTRTGYFHTETIGGRTYIIDPLGNPYFATGVNTVVYGDTQNQRDYVDAAYGSSEAFFTEISAALRDIGVNTAFVSDATDLLAIEENGLATVVSVVGIGGYMGVLGRSQVSEGVFPNNNTINIFDPDFVTYANQKNKERIEENGYADLPNLFGYTSDNELPSGSTLLERYLTVDPSIPENIFSYQTAWAWLARKMNTPNPTLELLRSLPAEEYAAYNGEFLSFVYATYYRVIRDAIKAADPNHMYIGSRVNGNCPYDEGYLRAAGKYLDIITTNLYDGLNPKSTTLNAIYRYSGKPFIVTEFYAKALDTIDAGGYKLANTTGAGILVFTQKERATYYEHYVLNLLETKACVGWVWYRFRDNDQRLYTVVGKDGTTYENVKLLSMVYGEHPYPHSLMDADGNVYWLSDFYDGKPEDWTSATTTVDGKTVNVFTQTHFGEGLASNHNVNKGFYNNNFSSVVTVYTYNADGTLRTFLYEDENSTMTQAELLTFGSVSYEVEDPSSAYLPDGTVLTSKDGTGTFRLGRRDNADGTYTVTKLTVYKGRYVEVTDKVKEISDNLVGLLQYFK